MLFLYNLVISIAGFFLKIVALFSPKIKLFTEGRKNVFAILEEKIKPSDKTIWFHSASLGEYEQGLPVIEKIKEKYPSHKIIVTFFSPSGYEVRKNNTVADTTVYLPLDTKSNAKKFLKLVHPELAFFIKYEFWLNYLKELETSQTPTYLVSGIFRDNQMFFKWYGGFYRKALKAFTYFFVQNESSKEKIEAIGFHNVIVSGDTRFDRVNAILERDNTLDFIESFKNNAPAIVIGSSWPKDEALIAEYINQAPEDVKFIIAPHNIKAEQIASLKSQITKSTVLFSEKKDLDLSDFNVFIIDTVGLLTKIYSYGTIAYVGGGFGNPGIHNILEPATFGIPIVIGPNYSNFAEATQLVSLGGCIVISNKEELKQNLDRLLADKAFLEEKSRICKTYIQDNKGATNTIMNIVS
ncbi:3-deoxy-D-manno-octulosonic acid transferase [Flavobacterium aquidurense]|jgi:3-deoxy-D-manno-octulosonic-acid transferase|uniref:3-deoxy-D-manno-octulosonic acid transferase n=1 Tax=Flavobacterium aquidurense TaxID=362413 RepID=UPI000912942F|nr:glycosyltransferase N-terminal domain-containing protein [Flavobacterium aquidurense]OXA69299.1 3-deoxy-D-manno-octulosonic acid transferase [Flavobacterium aquidurense]SHH02524.1 3-deoxy-D-manno-octulosonic-acid transferase [Flavobacterium frigidimaris]